MVRRFRVLSVCRNTLHELGVRLTLSRDAAAFARLAERSGGRGAGRCVVASAILEGERALDDVSSRARVPVAFEKLVARGGIAATLLARVGQCAAGQVEERREARENKRRERDCAAPEREAGSQAARESRRLNI